MLKITSDAELHEPVLVLAYAGWNDGGESATSALRSLLSQFTVSKLATIETEEFFDFTVARPHVRVDESDRRVIDWPDHEFSSVSMGGANSDLVLGLGIEPHLRWKRYSRAVLDMVQHRWPVAEKNKNDHAKLMETLSGSHQRYNASGYNYAEASRLVDTLEQWLADHICRLDMHLKKCVKK